jgi:hypothetical protein
MIPTVDFVPNCCTRRGKSGGTSQQALEDLCETNRCGTNLTMAEPPTSPPRSAKGRAPHRRDDNARLAVLHAADDLLVERGLGGVTVEGIAARAGVAKQTIYRWRPSEANQ